MKTAFTNRGVIFTAVLIILVLAITGFWDVVEEEPQEIQKEVVSSQAVGYVGIEVVNPAEQSEDERSP